MEPTPTREFSVTAPRTRKGVTPSWKGPGKTRLAGRIEDTHPKPSRREVEGFRRREEREGETGVSQHLTLPINHKDGLPKDPRKDAIRSLRKVTKARRAPQPVRDGISILFNFPWQVDGCLLQNKRDASEQLGNIWIMTPDSSLGQPEQPSAAKGHGPTPAVSHERSSH